jgi:hypothetical protein
VLKALLGEEEDDATAGEKAASGCTHESDKEAPEGGRERERAL